MNALFNALYFRNERAQQLCAKHCCTFISTLRQFTRQFAEKLIRSQWI